MKLLLAFPVLLGLGVQPIVAQAIVAQERKVDPTFLHRAISQVEPREVDLSAAGCRYKPLFGTGDSEPEVVRGFVRFGELTLSPKAACKPVTYPTEEQAYVIMEGQGILHYGATVAPIRRHDFTYLPAGIAHWVENKSDDGLTLYVMGFRVPEGTLPPTRLLMSNYDDVKKVTVSGHPDSVLYQLLMGDVNSKRDRLAAGHLLTSLYLMEFQPGGTNFPHHHDSEEEIYVLLDGEGQIVAGSGMNGIEGLFPAKTGDAYFFRLNCTVGFYNSQAGPAHILGVRSLYPRPGLTLP
jgi:mannose-6-phosphate isomerase-like protein (cupin superfamily)